MLDVEKLKNYGMPSDEYREFLANMANIISTDKNVIYSNNPEAIIANHAGKEIIGISFLANMAAGVLDQPLSGEEVTEASRHITEKFSAVVDMALTV